MTTLGDLARQHGADKPAERAPRVEVPVGQRYNGIVKGAAVRDTQSGSPRLVLTLEVGEGSFAGALCFLGLMLNAEHEISVKVFSETLHACGIDADHAIWDSPVNSPANIRALMEDIVPLVIGAEVRWKQVQDGNYTAAKYLETKPGAASRALPAAQDSPDLLY